MVNREKVRARAEKREEERKKSTEGSFSFWRPTGEHHIRFLSNLNTGDCYWEAKKHSFINDDIKNVVCPKSADEVLGIRNSCPICDLAKIYFQDNNREVARKMSPKTRFTFTLLDMDQIDQLKEEELKEAGNLIYLFERGPRFFDDFCQYIIDEDWGDVTSPSEGITFKLKKTGSGINTKISLLPSPQGQSALPAPLQEIVETDFPVFDKIIFPSVSAREIYYLLDDEHREVLAEHGKTAENYQDKSVLDIMFGDEGELDEEKSDEVVEETNESQINEKNEEESKEEETNDIDELKKKVKAKAAAMKKKKGVKP